MHIFLQLLKNEAFFCLNITTEIEFEIAPRKTFPSFKKNSRYAQWNF